MAERLKRLFRVLGDHGARFAAGLAFAGAVYLIFREMNRDPAEDSTLTTATLILIVLAVLMLFILIAPGSTRNLFHRMANLKVAGVLEVGMQTVARAEILRPPPVGDEQKPPERKRRGLKEIVAEVEEKLNFVHTIIHIHEKPRPPRSERQIALWLGMEGLLTDSESQFVLDLISNRELGIEALADREREELLDAAWTFAMRFRFTVWDRHVRRELQKAGWVIADFPQQRDHQADFLAYRDGRWAAMATKVGELGGYHYVTTRDRLEELEEQELKGRVGLDGACIVFPGGDRMATVVSRDGKRGKKSPVKVLELRHLLQEPQRAFRSNRWNDDFKRSRQAD